VRLRSGGVWRLRSGRDVCLRAVGLTLIVTLLLGLPASALAQSVSGPGNPLSPGLPQNQTPTQPTTTPAPVPQAPTTSTASGTGLSGSGTLVIAIGALVILGGISLFIWRDARRRAPVRARAGGAGGGAEGSRTGSKARQKPRKLSPAERRRRKRGRAR